MKADIFLFGELPVRVVHIDDEPWFVANDAGKILGIQNVRKSVAEFPEDEKDAVTTSDAMGRDQKTTVLSEPGLYRLIFQSRKAEAERFKKWVFSEVLPAIRQTGCYGVASAAAAEVAEVKRTLLTSMEGLLAGSLPVAKAQAVAVLAQRWLEAHRAEQDSYGHANGNTNEAVPGLRGRRAGGNRLLSPEGRDAADAVPGMPQPGVPGEGEGEAGLPGEADGGEAGMGEAESETETPA